MPQLAVPNPVTRATPAALFNRRSQQSPDGVEIADKQFRTCDFYAWLLSNRIEGAPTFQLYWPEDQRDIAISALEKMMKAYTAPLKTCPFQEI